MIGQEQAIGDHASMAAQAAIASYVASLPELYQPIFGYPELSVRVTRDCEDRLASLTLLYQTLEAKLQRPLRVLDLGCAQGFFSFGLASLGARVHGVDFHGANTAVCTALADEHPGLAVTFETAHVEDIIARLSPDQYDLVLGLSVFHHLVHRNGIKPVQGMLSTLADKIAFGVFEMALASEPSKVAHAQPQNPRQLLDGFAFVHQFAQNGTHFSGNNRPLYIASNRYWLLNDRIEAFERWQEDSHELARGTYGGTRRYFFGNGCVAKIFTLNLAERREINIQENLNEVSFLSNPPAGFKAPALIVHGHNTQEVWLVREQLPGELLLDKIRAGKPYVARRIVQDILQQLAALEAAGLYHDDLRTWNILVAPDGHAALIDYGAIVPQAKDRGWPYNIFLSFMVVLREILTGSILIPDPIRPASFNPDIFPEPYSAMWWEMFARPPGEWSFAFLWDCFVQSRPNGLPLSTPRHPGFAMVLQVMDDACKIHQNATKHWRHRAAEIEALAEQLQEALRHVDTHLNNTKDTLNAP